MAADMINVRPEDKQVGVCTSKYVCVTIFCPNSIFHNAINNGVKRGVSNETVTKYRQVDAHRFPCI